MSNEFVDFLQQHVPDSPENLLVALQENNITNFEDYLEFANFNALTLKLAEALASENTISKETLMEKYTEGFLCIGQSIDGDFLIGNLSETYILPKSFYLADIEKFQLTLEEFLLALAEKASPSNYIK